MVLAVVGSGTSAVAASDTSAVAVSGTSVVLVFAISPPTTDLSVIFTDLSSFTASTDLSSFTASTDIFSFAVLSSLGPLSTTPMVEGVRGCATARSSQEAHTGGSVTAGASAGKNLIMRCLLRAPPLVCGIPIYSAPMASAQAPGLVP